MITEYFMLPLYAMSYDRYDRYDSECETWTKDNETLDRMNDETTITMTENTVGYQMKQVV